MIDDGAAMFRELCVDLGFCSLGVDGEDRVLAQLPSGAEQAARAVFAAEGLDFDTYERESVKTAVRECIARHLEDRS
ncbi:hypothetical protein [Brevundimonas sp.]|uniref:hypothetical protein n=1 Tax=Brevundimonas sp. TaxID=1871086 RepID=UPI002731FDDD|nr:hypothetical protein [Brevundimonas sp.]MDP1914091.1 hypothetical protein [Brevundimonas sp.]